MPVAVSTAAPGVRTPSGTSLFDSFFMKVYFRFNLRVRSGSVGSQVDYLIR